MRSAAALPRVVWATIPRGRLRSIVATVAVATVVVGGASLITGIPTPAPPPPSGVHVWMSPSGNDNTCVRNDQGRPCLTLNKAWQIAQAGDSVEIAAGTYSGQQNIFPNSKGSNAVITFQPALGATVTFTGQVQPGCSFCTFDGSTGTMNWSGGFEIGYPDVGTPQVTNITLEHIDGIYNQSQVLNATNVLIDDIVLGNHTCSSGCEDGLRFNDPTVTGGDSGDPSNVIVQNSTFFNLMWTDPNAHPDMIAVSAGHNLTFRNNKFWWMGSQGLYLISEVGGNIHDVLIENNWFGECDTPGDINVCFNSLILDVKGGLSNITVRNNSFQLGTNGGAMRVSGVGTATNIVVTGNTGPTNACGYAGSGATYSYNVWSGSTCGATDTNANPGYVNSATGATMDLHLASTSSPACNHANPSSFPSTDFDGDSRPLGSAAEAGADEKAGC